LSFTDILRTRGKGFQMRTFALFGAKHIKFVEIYGVSALTREEARMESVVAARTRLHFQSVCTLCTPSNGRAEWIVIVSKNGLVSWLLA